jgi:hypothetical protein
MIAPSHMLLLLVKYPLACSGRYSVWSAAVADKDDNIFDKLSSIFPKNNNVKFHYNALIVQYLIFLTLFLSIDVVM